MVAQNCVSGDSSRCAMPEVSPGPAQDHALLSRHARGAQVDKHRRASCAAPTSASLPDTHSSSSTSLSFCFARRTKPNSFSRPGPKITDSTRWFSDARHRPRLFALYSASSRASFYWRIQKADDGTCSGILFRDSRIRCSISHICLSCSVLSFSTLRSCTATLEIS